MREYYQLSVAEYESLTQKVSMKELVAHASIFSPNLSPVSKISLMLYIDQYGDFSEGHNAILDTIAMAIFNSMDSADKVEIMQYTELKTWQ